VDSPPDRLTVVAATGLAFIPTMFTRMGRRIREERLLLVYPRALPL